MSLSGAGGAGINAMHGRLAVTMPVRLTTEALAGIRDEVLERLRVTTGGGVIFDMSTVAALDAREFNALADVVRMINIMGRRAVFSGFPPGVVSSLLDLDVDTGGITTFRGVDEALEFFGPEEDSGDSVAETAAEEPAAAKEDLHAAE